MDVPSLIVIVVVGLIVIFTLGFLIVQFIDRFDFSAVDVDPDPTLFNASDDDVTSYAHDKTFMVINSHHEFDHFLELHTSSSFDDDSFSSMDTSSSFDD